MKEIYNSMILSFSNYEPLYFNCVNNMFYQTWICSVIKKYNFDLEDVYFLGVDDLNRVEIAIPINIFEFIKGDRFFIYKCANLRRLRLSEKDNIGKLLYCNYNNFDNDLDKK